MVVYSDRFVPEGSAGCVRILLIPIILIRPAYRDDRGLLAHEECHVDQAWRNVFPMIHWLRYRFSRSYRLACEVEAYRVQLGYSQHNVLIFAEFISAKYGLDIAVADAAALLTD